MAPQISIIVPTYNTEQYLPKCLDSLINQTLKDIEIICVDDASTDNSAEIIRKYIDKDKRIKLLEHSENKGSGAARNTGLKEAKSEFIAFIDSDDYVDLDTYEKALSFMSDDVDMVCFGIQTYGHSDKTRKKSDDEYYAVKYSGKTLVNEDVLNNTDVSSCNKIFRKSLIDKFGISHPEKIKYEDNYIFYTYCFQIKNIYFIQDKFYHYLRHENSIMDTTFSHIKGVSIDHAKIGILIYQYMKEHLLLDRWKYFFLNKFLFFIDFALYHEDNADYRNKIYNLANSFIAEENLLNEIPPLLKHDYEMLKNKTFPAGEFTKLGGLLKIHETKIKKIYKILGIPFFRIKYSYDKTKYYCLFHIYTKKIHSSPRISVLMPAYNAGEYIEEAINSILKQTFTDFEFIIINDGSTDNTAEIVKKFDDKRIKFIDNNQNQGLVAVLNYGLDIAKGEYIARMDSDDIAYSQRFEKQIKFMDKHPKVGILGTWFHMFGSGVDRIEKKLKYPKLKDMIKISQVGHPTAMLRTSVFRKYNLHYDAKYKHAEDYELWTRAIDYTKIANLQEVLLDYRWSGNNVSIKNAKEQIIKSELIKAKISRKIGSKRIRCINVGLDDTLLLTELNKMNEFSYMPNSGNIGDMLIASATMKWFDENGLKWHRTAKEEFPENFVYGGGGPWLHEWIEYLKPVMDKMKKAKRVVILPSSFDNVPELIQILDERFVVFCREKKSYDYLMAQNTKAKILLDHDMAFRIHGKLNKKIEFPSNKWKKRYKKLMKQLSKLNKNVHLFREDSESLGHYATDLDLSEYFGHFTNYETREVIDFAAETMIRSMRLFDFVETDRLHVAISATLTGADVLLYDNSYGKCSGVYNQTLHILPNVKLKERQDI